MRKRWIKHDRLTSTNSFLSDLIKQGAPEEGTVVIADYQDAGRGLGEHSWDSRRGENLLMSLLLFPAFLSAKWQFHLSRLASLALCDVLETQGISALIKWPNDILTEKGKIAGILIEHSITAKIITHTIIGMGLNLNQTDFPTFQVPATSLALETGRSVDVTTLGELVEDSLMSRYHDLKEGRTEKLEREYLERLFMVGLAASFEAGEENFQGRIQGVNDFGELMVERDGEIRAYAHGAISMELKFA
jgi:BirA family biotin operon repressor/biotin-[acetyl-CoA-carboxylase] ligase